MGKTSGAIGSILGLDIVGIIIAFVFGWIAYPAHRFDGGVFVTIDYFLLSISALVCIVPLIGTFLWWGWLGPFAQHWIFAHITGYNGTWATTLTYYYVGILGTISSLIMVVIFVLFLALVFRD